MALNRQARQGWRLGRIGAAVTAVLIAATPVAAQEPTSGEWRFISADQGLVRLVNTELETDGDGLVTSWELWVVVEPRTESPRGTKVFTQWETDCARRRARGTYIVAYEPGQGAGPPNHAVSEWFPEEPETKAAFDAVCNRAFGESFGDTADEAAEKALTRYPDRHAAAGYDLVWRNLS